MSTIQNFIIVDDDPWSNNIGAFNIRKALGEVQIKSFVLPQEALNYIEGDFIKDAQPTILFLDINMPLINGWQFLQRFSNFSDDIKSNITIYILSSSINPSDMDKAKACKLVKEFISKPLLRDSILMVANNNVTTSLNNF